MNVLKLLMLPVLALGLTSCDESSSGFDINKVDKSVVRIELALRKNTDGKLRRWGHGTGFVIADGLIISVDGKFGILYLTEATPERFTILSKVRLLDKSRCWAPLALSRGKLIIRDTNQMKCLLVK